MWWKVLVAAVVLAVLGVAAGYAVGAGRDESPVSTGLAVPVPAVSPMAPTPAPAECLPDPDRSALGVALPSQTRSLSTGRKRGYGLDLQVPDGWTTTRVGQTEWKFGQPPLLYNTYVLRVTIVAGLHVAAEVYRDQRIAAYRSAQRNGALADFTVESEAGDTFVATFTAAGFCRVTMERVVTLGTSSAYADVAVTGRVSDRQGMLDLLARTSASMVRG